MTQTDAMKTIPELKMIYPLLLTAKAIQKEYAMLMYSEPLKVLSVVGTDRRERVFPVSEEKRNTNGG